MVGEPQAPGATLNQQNMKRCLLWDSWEESPQVIFFLRRRKREMQERSTTFVALEGGCLYIIYAPALATLELGGGRRATKTTSQSTKTAARVSKDTVEPLSSSTLEPLCQARFLNMRLKCPYGLRGLWAPRIPLAPLGSGDQFLDTVFYSLLPNFSTMNPFRLSSLPCGWFLLKPGALGKALFIRRKDKEERVPGEERTITHMSLRLKTNSHLCIRRYINWRN